jgi:hypothetical protein
VRTSACLFIAFALVCAGPPAAAQTSTACRVLCAPQVLVEPTVTIEDPFGAARVRTTEGDEVRAPRAVAYELLLAVDLPTRLPRLGFTAEAIFPLSKDDNAVEVELEVSLGLIQSEQTHGWLSSHFDVVDKVSPAERPIDRAAYSHKLNLEWDTAFAIFKRLPEGNWLRGIELETSLDYVATGLPRRGDLVDGKTFLTDASPWSLSLVVVFPITP